MNLGGTAIPKPTVLIVDDEEVIRQLCMHALTEYTVLAAEDGTVALELLEREQIDLVLTDVMMPGIDGLELLHQIKARLPNLAVVVMTGFTDKEIILQALKANADDFIAKPLNILQLRTTVRTALNRQQLRAELFELKRMDRLKSEFLGLVSHKLKTPSTSISLFLQNLAEGAIELDDPGSREALDLARKELRYLDYLIRDLLYYSEVILHEGPLQLEALAPGDLIHGALSEVAVEAETRGVEIEVGQIGTLPTIELDRKRMAFVLRALLENAVKFTPPGGKVTLRVDTVNGSLRIRVEDAGVGIAPDELPKIFEKFYQVDPAHCGQVRGFGLGLYYARLFAQNHGGSVHLDSRPGVGTTATVLMPLHRG